ncbi:MAG: acryloyl-CoA reductase [Acidimicrobiaceae bacterium]|nr:acryloyl-CoA reductase [Acidimicrobiaceae bacterium]
MVVKQWWVVPGETEAVPELREVRVPTPGAGQVLVRMAGAGVNRGELISGRLLRIDNPNARPRPSGIEIAGIVETLGDGVDGWAVGDRVIARGSACHAELVALPAEALMTSPEPLNDTEAAGIPNVFVTAHDALITNADVTSSDSVLITAGSSGVGTAAIQIAKNLGATVIATTRSASKSEALTQLGADLVVDTTVENWASVALEELGPVSCVIDQVGGDLFPECLRVMDVLGRYVSVGRNAGPSSNIDLDLVAKNRLTIIGVTFRTRTPAETFECTKRFASDVLPLFDDGTLRPIIDRTFKFDDLPAAHTYMRSDNQFGKIIIVA